MTPSSKSSAICSRMWADKAKIAGVGVTGSGRYLVGSFIGADLIKNEITAQTRAAAEIDPEADIIEIGGQDSKLVIKRNGVVVDYQMNKACAAGTGSFIDELAEMLGVSRQERRLRPAGLRGSPYHRPGHPVRRLHGTGSRLGPAGRGVRWRSSPPAWPTPSPGTTSPRWWAPESWATKSSSPARSSTTRPWSRPSSEQLPGKTITRRRAQRSQRSHRRGPSGQAEHGNGDGSKFKGFQKVIDSDCNLSTFICKSCDNNCTITRMDIPGEKPTFYGSRCDLYDSSIATKEKGKPPSTSGRRLLFGDYEEKDGRPDCRSSQSALGI